MRPRRKRNLGNVRTIERGQTLEGKRLRLQCHDHRELTKRGGMPIVQKERDLLAFAKVLDEAWGADLCTKVASEVFPFKTMVYRASGRCGAAPRCGRMSEVEQLPKTVDPETVVSRIERSDLSNERTGNDSRKTFAYVRISACVLVFSSGFGLVRSRRRPSGPSHERRNSRPPVVLSMAIWISFPTTRAQALDQHPRLILFSAVGAAYKALQPVHHHHFAAGG